MRKTFITIIIALLFIIGSAWWITSSEEKTTPYFSEAFLKDEKILPKDNTKLMVKVKNPGDNVYENIKISVFTKSDFLFLEYPLDHQEGKSITLSPPNGLASSEETKFYSLCVKGELPPSVILIKVKIKAQVIADNRKTDEKTLYLKIEE